MRVQSNVKYKDAPKNFQAEKVCMNGVTKTVQAWCDEIGIHSQLVYRRRNRFFSWAESFSLENKKAEARNLLSARNFSLQNS